MASYYELIYSYDNFAFTFTYIRRESNESDCILLICGMMCRYQTPHLLLQHYYIFTKVQAVVCES